MNKEKLMQFLSEAIDNGAKVELLFFGNGESKQTAEKRIKEFSEIIGEEVIERHNNDTTWFKTEKSLVAAMAHFYDYDEYMQEDVRLDGEADAI